MHVSLILGALIGMQESPFNAIPFPTASAHASTIVETRRGLAIAWFGGTREGARDVGIWMSRETGGVWSAPVEIATGAQSDGRRYACYNPVLFELPDGTLRLYYKVGPQPALWWGMMQSSRDAGVTWSAAERMPEGLIGPVKNKPVRLANGTIISGSSTETVDADPVWRVHFELSRDGGVSWHKVAPRASAAGPDVHAIQPSILVHADGRLQAVGRSRSGRVFETWSADSGASWSAVSLTELPNPNAGTDALTLRDGRHIMVYNHTAQGRTPLNIAVSRDGRAWRMVRVLESAPGEYSYPALIQARDGTIHVTYTWNRQRIKHVALAPTDL